MTDSRRCPRCQRQVPSDSPGGVCPNCLLAQALPGSSAETPRSRRVTPPPAVDEIADLFPQLEILELIGQGGMGAVYKARQIKLDRFVALKIIRPEAADDPTFAERFNREARTLARLNHPGIVGVYDFGEATLPAEDVESAASEERPSSPLYYFVMEYVDGVDLRELLNDGPLPSAQVLAIVPQICEALQYAHAEGVVHRDVKPENILLDAKGRVKIADFGLAKLAAPGGQDFTLTATHQVMGTPRYMAPEQMEGSRAVDHRADIYSLGVVFYEMLTGQVPAGHFEPPSKHSSIDARLDEVVLRALARDPNRRYQQATELSSQVNTVRGVPDDPWSPPPASGVHPGPPVGPSTLIERVVGDAIQGVRRGGLGRGLAHPNTPGIVALLLGLGLAMTFFLPWGIWRIDTPEMQRVRQLFGFSHPFSAIIGGIGFVLAISLFAAGTRPPVPRWRGQDVLLAGIVTLGLCWLYRRAAIVMDDVVGQMQILEGFPVALGLGIALMVVGAWDMRRWPRKPAQKLPDDAADQREAATYAFNAVSSRPASGDAAIANDLEDELSLPSLWMMIVGVLMVIGHVVWIFLLFGSYLVNLGWLLVPGIVGGMLMFVGGIHLRMMGSPDWARAGAWAGILPLSPGWLLSAIPCWSVLRILSRPGIEKAFEEASHRSRQAPAGPSPSGRDWVTLTREQIEGDALPDVCIVCGAPAQERVNQTFSYQAEWAQLLTYFGMLFCILPGMIVESLTRQELRIACPVCRQHVRFWSRFHWWAGLGWLIPVVLGGAGLLVGWIIWPGDFPVTDQNGVAVLIGAAIGLMVYLVPLIRMFLTRIDAEEITDTSIRLRRVSAAFAQQAGNRSVAGEVGQPQR